MFQKLFSAIAITLISNVLLAQVETDYSVEELTKYATVMQWAEKEKSKMTKAYNGWINKNEQLTVTRFLSMKRAAGDTVKLQGLAPTAAELTAFNTIMNDYDSIVLSFTDRYKSKIKEEVGAKLFNNLKKSLMDDDQLQERYKSILATLNNGDEVNN